MFRRISAISLTYAGVLAFNTLYIQSIGSGIGLYSGLFKVSVLSNFIALFILVISSIIILIWPNFDNSSLNLTQYNNSLKEGNHITNNSKNFSFMFPAKTYIGFYNFIKNFNLIKYKLNKYYKNIIIYLIIKNNYLYLININYIIKKFNII